VVFRDLEKWKFRDNRLRGLTVSYFNVKEMAAKKPAEGVEI
jgi:hypothetical protein